MDVNFAYDIIGIAGAVLILVGFYRLSIGKWQNKSLIYELDNLVGAALLAVYQLYHHAYITMVVNVIWAIIAFRGLTSFAERYNSTKKKRRKV